MADSYDSELKGGFDTLSLHAGQPSTGDPTTGSRAVLYMQPPLIFSNHPNTQLHCLALKNSETYILV